MTEPQPTNPFSVTENFREVAPALVNALVETLAFISAPAWGPSPFQLLPVVAHLWSVRMTGGGREDVSHATVWELSRRVHQLAMDGPVPFPPFDISSTCVEDGCDVDHDAQIHTINNFLLASVEGDYSAAVKAFGAHVAKDSPEEWADSRVQYVAMLAVHVAERIGEYRSNAVDEMPSLG